MMSLTLLRCRVSQSVADVNVINRNRPATSICGVVSHFRSLPQRNRFSLRRRDGSSRYYSEVKVWNNQFGFSHDIPDQL